MRVLRWLSLAVVATFAVSVSAILVDTDRDGSADLELLDTLGNGSFDTIVNLSQEFSGVEAPAKLLDLDQDGRHDLQLIDSDADGIHDTIVELETEADIEAPEASSFKIKPVIVAGPASPADGDVPVFHPYGSLAKKTKKSNKFTVIIDPSAPPKQPLNKCRCNRAPKKPKEYVGAEIYPAPVPAPAVKCGCNNVATPAAPQHIAPRYYKAAPAPAAPQAPAKPAAPAPVFVAPEFHPEPVAAPAPAPVAAAAAAPAPPALVAPEYYP